MTEKKTKVVAFSTTAIDTVIYEGKAIKITYKGWEKDAYDYLLKFAYENTSDKKYEVQSRDGKIDDIASTDDNRLIYYSDTLEPSSSSENCLNLSPTNLKAVNSTEPKVLECRLEVVYHITETVAKLPK